MLAVLSYSLPFKEAIVMMFSLRRWALVAAGIALVPGLLLLRARGSDHADTPSIAASPGTDLSDVYIFPSPNDASNVVLVMNVRPLIPQGQGANFSFDPTVLYQFKIDNTGDSVEDLVIQARFGAAGANQTVSIAGPAPPTQTGTVATALTPFATTGVINQTFTPTPGMTVFAGAREDSFFFDLEEFFRLLPDRATPVNGVPVPLQDANTPQPPLTFRPAGQAVDFLSNGGFNVLSIVVELPRSALAL